ncbi:hypothetical protein [Polyangium jinanense]|uniref:Uncharacterized protein n=1 Tax=Polyangium jinanense TaxID=2829994 RepID=A0A9X3X1U9_9BACT|nr:hypothetical protein [Polyangium jinanense]MDC3954440.1 hypothetical protein [Polyangium jinanense]MDC3980743.1 hypothetical protein [Polyangium jinanense]
MVALLVDATSCSSSPTSSAEGRRVPLVRSIAAEARPLAGGSTSGVGTGGMTSNVVIHRDDLVVLPSE